MRVNENGRWNDRKGDLDNYDLPFVCKKTTSTMSRGNQSTSKRYKDSLESKLTNSADLTLNSI